MNSMLGILFPKMKSADKTGSNPIVDLVGGNFTQRNDSQTSLTKDLEILEVDGPSTMKREQPEESQPVEEGRSKRRRKSRMIIIDGNSVLRENNYDLEGFISVFDRRDGEYGASMGPEDMEMDPNMDQTFHTEIGETGGTYRIDRETGEQYYISAGGKVYKVAAERAKMSRPKPAPKPKAERKVDKVVQAHSNNLRDSRECSEKSRLVFIAKNLELFRPFLSGAFLAKAEAALSSKTRNDGRVARFKQFRPDEQPSCLDSKAMRMRDYQIAGVNFMLKMYSEGMSCILADEMGLGKTIQTIAFLGSLKFDLRVSGPHLVVVPMSVLSNWMSEFKKFCPKLVVKRFHCTDMEEKLARRAEILAGATRGTIDVVVTTYEMLVSEKSAGIASMRYRYLVLDEAHKVKNDVTNVSSACKRVTRELSLFLTGTPVQNNLRECWSMLNCMQPDIFSRSDMFDDAFDANDMGKTNMELVDSVWRLLQVLVLRRKKTDVDLRLPIKRELRVLCPLSPMQSFWYKRILIMNAHILATGTGEETDAKTGVKSAPASDSNSKKMKISNLLMQLRKISNHPFLFPQIEDMKEENTLEDYVQASGKLHMLQLLLETLLLDGHRVVIFSQFTSMLNIIEDFLLMMGYKIVRLDGSTNRIQRMINIGRFNAPGSELSIFLLSTRAGGLGVNLQTADTCILFDSDWNPQCDIQAMGRVHRIGQTKPVTIYRMVASGTVEERIVARATRKLLLDEMVSGGTEKMLSQAGTMQSSTFVDGEEGDEPPSTDDVADSDMKKALLFSMKRMFKANGGVSARHLDDDEDGDACSEENLTKILDALKKESESSLDATLAGIEEEEEEVDDKCFSLTADSTKTREFQGEDFSLSKLYSGKSLLDIRNEWAAKQQILEGNRERVQRLVMVNGGVGVGKVGVLKNNLYSLQGGEPSVISKEERLRRQLENEQFKSTTRLLRSGRDYHNFDFCQACGHAGSNVDVVLCDGCPMTYHVACLGFKNKKEFVADQESSKGIGGSKYYCPHHTCSGCQKSSAMCGNLLMRCLGCAAAFCEDCAHFDAPDPIVIIPEQPPFPLQTIGFTRCNQAVYILCSKQCAVSASQTTFTAFNYLPGIKKNRIRKGYHAPYH